MPSLKENLQEKTTAELQNCIKYNLLIVDVASIARTILEERGAAIPEPVPEETIEANHKKTRGNSNRSFLITLVLICLWIGYALATGLFEHGQQNRLNRSMLVAFVAIASVWGWDVFGRKK